MKKPTIRNQFGALLTARGLLGKAVEVGVAEGGFSFFLLDHWPGICYQVDPWKHQDTPGYSGHGTEDQDGRYADICRKAIDYNGRAIPVRMTSVEAAPTFANGWFDFIYIDAIHTYESNSLDLELWYPKLRTGGIFAGHDYLNGTFHGQSYGVKQAVDEFAVKHGLTVNVISEEWPSWWMEKV